MKFFSRFPVFRFLIPFVAGICIYLSNPSSWFPGFVLIAGAGYFASAVFTSRGYAIGRYAQRWLAGIPFYCCFLGLGFVESRINNTSKFNNHFLIIDQNQFLVGLCKSAPQRTSKGSKVIIEVHGQKIGTEWGSARGNLLVFAADTQLASLAKKGDRIFVHGKPKRIQGAMLPGGFDPAEYYAGKGCYFQCYIRPGDFLHSSETRSRDLFALAEEVRASLLTRIKEHLPDTSTHGVAGALLLGYEDWLDPELETSYNGAGVLHVLCVSGMHVMLIYMILDWLLTFLLPNRFGKFTRYLLLLLLIWFYAMLTGFTPSVLRAAAMVSFIIMAKWIGRNVSIYNLLCASCILLFGINPWLIVSPGFQLSFLAVCGIVFIHPYLKLWYQPANGILQKTWELISVSISAQLATMPLSIWMFHQFPNYFLAGNLVLVPLSTITIYSGMLMLSLSWMPAIADLVGWTTSILIRFLNATVEFISNLPGALTEGIFISAGDMILIYLFIASLILWLIYKHNLILRITLSISVLLLGNNLYRIIDSRNNHELMIIPGSKQAHIGLIHGDKVCWVADTVLLNSFIDKSVKNYVGADGISRTTKFSLLAPGCYEWQKSELCIVNYAKKSGIITPNKTNKPGVLLITGKADQNLISFVQHFNPKFVVVDKTISTYYSGKLDSIFKQKGIPVHKLNEQALILQLTKLKTSL